MTISRAQMRRQLYAGGGIAGLVPRQQYGLGSIVKSIKGAVSGVVDAATDFAKSDIGQIALAVAAPYALGPAFGAIGLGGNVAGSAFLGNALRAGITNLALQGVTTGKFNLGQAAKAGIISGGIQTGLNKFTAAGKYDPYKTTTTGDVTTGSDILYDDMTFYPEAGTTYSPDPGVPIRTDQFANQNLTQVIPDQNNIQFPDDVMNEYASIISNESPSVDFGMTSAKADPLTSFQQDYRNVYEGIGAELEPGAIPVNTGDEIFKGAFANEQYDLPSGGIGMENIEGKYGQTIGTRFTDVSPEPGVPGATSVLKGGGVEDISLADRAGKFSTSVQDVFKEGATLSQRATSAVDAIKQISGAAMDRPLSTLTIASLISAASVPKQPEESEFDYEARISLVNDFASKYGKLAGVDMSNLGNISDFESYYKQRAKVAVGGLPEIPMGQPRQNQGGITELDYRDQGGFVPVGIKEKADDVPAMLSKNEFVFTADAVRNFGGGDVDKGAQKLYNVMKTLENGGTV